ncbi:hypothetical protein BpHYR1_034972 [Brachionus plicatilis]|uniref:Uncharacterized protein n=1 Tax=Brachionus plicatilis TaxID=10195 RepID=A0A3M7S3W5_BRAPC|nr:hypothetical protein BpHYR1_034972 [Brachionus plicatilis]
MFYIYENVLNFTANDIKFFLYSTINLHFGEENYNLIIRKNDNLCLNLRFSKHSFIESVIPMAMSCLNDLFLAFIREGSSSSKNKKNSRLLVLLEFKQQK